MNKFNKLIVVLLVGSVANSMCLEAMKRKRNDNEKTPDSGGGNKREKVSHTEGFSTIPHDLLSIIFTYTDFIDLNDYIQTKNNLAQFSNEKTYQIALNTLFNTDKPAHEIVFINDEKQPDSEYKIGHAQYLVAKELGLADDNGKLLLWAAQTGHHKLIVN